MSDLDTCHLSLSFLIKAVGVDYQVRTLLVQDFDTYICTHTFPLANMPQHGFLFASPMDTNMYGESQLHESRQCLMVESNRSWFGDISSYTYALQPEKETT